MASRSWLGDAVPAGVLAIAGVIGSAIAGALAEVPIDALGFALVVGAAVVTAFRRRWPLGVLGVVTGCALVYLVLGYPYGPILVTFMVAVYTVARQVPAGSAVPWAVGALGAMLVHVPGSTLGFPGMVPVCAWVVVPFAVGFGLRLRREVVDRERAEAIRQSVDAERLKVAQEVHDIVGHGLAAIKMQADVALHVLSKRPGQARPALETISRTGSDALEELRAALALMRTPERSPAPGLGRVDELRRRLAEAGVRVRVETSGRPRVALPLVVDLTGYRIVQESLTNVLRHGGSGRADVSVRHGTDGVHITVSNPIGQVVPGQASGGTGIPGMRERVLALGGEFTAGPVDGRRFEVRARLPVGGRP